MASILALVAIAAFVYWIYWNLSSLRKNIAHAKRSGIPYIVTRRFTHFRTRGISDQIAYSCRGIQHVLACYTEVDYSITWPATTKLD
jgi:hypothetical protein